MGSGAASRKKNAGSIKLTLLVLIAAVAIAVSYAGKAGPAHDRNIKVVEIDLSNRFEVRPVLAATGGEPFSAVVDGLHPYAAINGTYYDENMKPLGDIVIDGKVVNRGGQRNAIAITKIGNVSFIRKSHGKFNWSGYWAGVAAGPRLIHKGKIVLDPVADGFSKSSLTKRAWRSAVGKTSKGKLLLVTARKSLTLGEFAKILQNLGSVEALNLDGGGACGLYYRGRYLSTPVLPMTNLLVVYEKGK